MGSTALSAGLDPEDMREVITAYQNCVRRDRQQFDGHVAKFMGDSVLAYFGYPASARGRRRARGPRGAELVRAVARLTHPADSASRPGSASLPAWSWSAI